MWALVHKIDRKMIGRCGLGLLDKTPEVERGYALDKVYWNQGLATEASFTEFKLWISNIKLGENSCDRPPRKYRLPAGDTESWHEI